MTIPNKTIPEDLITTKDVKRTESIHLNQVENRKEKRKLIDLSVSKYLVLLS